PATRRRWPASLPRAHAHPDVEGAQSVETTSSRVGSAPRPEQLRRLHPEERLDGLPPPRREPSRELGILLGVAEVRQRLQRMVEIGLLHAELLEVGGGRLPQRQPGLGERVQVPEVAAKPAAGDGGQLHRGQIPATGTASRPTSGGSRGAYGYRTRSTGTS